ncbi:polymorphic toxin-type HINT domain-containing protein [Actinoplanes sp. KI2]|uniref:RHS repeat-associated core domain-containing protein n=1 Tax=Actinoplanes sp. KI2 TaxID=2983315 RepID=UPI0021D5FC29|nr:RHS repeat-associated core domain-containing protein [Actinoplanes sp. KI2]MCU7729892.1 polymorphic toxin-type HINT domain-containing protein [Actinoplanes sp. KI2]
MRKNSSGARFLRRLHLGLAAGLALWVGACSAQEGTTAVQLDPRPAAVKADRRADKPAPRQRWGNAAGVDPVADGHRNTYRPPSLRSKYPPVKAPSLPANTAILKAAPAARKVTGFRTDGSSHEIVGQRGAHERTYANADGTQTTEYSTAPVNYRKADGSWAPVDTSLAADPAGGWRRDADSVALHIAGQADAAELVRVTLPGGGVLAYGANGARPATASVAGDTARFAGVWTDTDLELKSQPGALKETLVLGSADAPGTFVFPLHLTGLTASLSGNQVVLRDASGATAATIPAGYLIDAGSRVSKAVTYRLVTVGGGPALQLSIDRGWLAAKGRAFPVRLDPPVLGNGAATESLVVQGGSSHGGGDLAVGRRDGVNSASYLRFSGLVSDLANETIYSAQLSFAAFDAPSCKPRTLGVYPVTASWSSSTNTSYPGPAVGGALATSSFAQGYVGFNQTASACPVTGTVMDLGSKGRDLVQGWVTGKSNYGISLRAPVSDESAWKTIAGTSSANPPRLYVTHSPYNAKYSVPNPTPQPAVLQNQAGKVKVTVTNKSAMDWTASGFNLVYRVYDASTSAKVGQYVAATLPSTVARGATITLDATIRALPVGSYLIDFSMATSGGRVFTDEYVPPARIALRVDNIPPTVGALFPPNGYQSPTLTPQLWAQAVDLDAPPSQTLQYRFQYCSLDSSGNPTGCTTTAYQTKQAFTIPSGTFKWSTPYVWRAYVKDNTTEVVSGYASLTTAVPQPVITSRVANAPYGGNDREFNPDIGNYTTAAVDATVATAGPQLSITRSYNSLDPRRTLAFGVGWMSELDMRATADADGSGNVLVTYADGQQVRFGRNIDGTYAAPLGRTAQLTVVSGAYVLKDVSGTTYSFRGSDGRILTIVDKNGRTLQFAYDATTAQLLKMQWHSGVNVKTGRALSFGWDSTGTHVTSVSTDQVDGRALTWTYAYTGDVLNKVCAPGAQICTTYTYVAGSHYRSSVLDSGPDSYWRLGEKAGATSGGSEVINNLGKDAATLRNVTLEQPGSAVGSANTSGLFNGTTSVAELPKGVLKRSRDTAVELWFLMTTSQTGGPLIGYQDTAVDTTPTTGVPVLYVGGNGHVYGQFKNTATTPKPIDGGVDLRNNKWHHVVLSVTADVQTLYVDGSRIASKPASDGALDPSLMTFNQAGAAWATSPTSWPNWGSTAKRYFNGSLDEIAVYGHALSDQAVAAHYQYGSAQADLLSQVTLPSGKTSSETTYDTGGDRIAEYTDGNGGTWKIGQPTVYGGDTDLRRSVQVFDPANRPYLYEYDALAGRLLRSGSPLGITTRPEDGPLPSPSASPSPSPSQSCTTPDPSYPTFCTTIPDDSSGDPVFVEQALSGMVVRSFGYDSQGRQSQIVDENGNAMTMTFDARGNVTSRKTCRATNDCQTTYTSYTTPNASNPYDPKNDLPVEVRDPRSSSATDNQFRTVTAYNNAGDVTSETSPDSSVTSRTYTNGTELAYGSSTDTIAAGLIATATDAGGKVAKYRYTASGDLALQTMPTGLVTEDTFDALGRKVKERVVSDSYPDGVTTTFAYDDLGHLTTTTGPVTTNAVDGTKHQAVTTNAYDVDGNVVQTTVKDALDASEPARVTTIEYDEHNHETRTVNPEGDEQTQGWDRFGNRTSVVDGNGNHYEYAYTATNKLAEVRLYDFHDGGGDSSNPYVVLNSYVYDYGGRMAAQVDSMGRRLEYTYLGDNLLSKVVQKNFHNPDGSTRDLVVENNTYDAAGNLTRSVVDNGTLTTTNTIDSMGRIKSTTQDPGGVNRVTSYAYDLIGNVTKTTMSGSAINVPWTVDASATNVVNQVYNAATGRLDQEVATDGTNNRTTSYTYDQRGYTLTKTDPQGNVSGADKTAYTTTYRYDENGDQTTVIAPAVSTESGGAGAQTTNPTVLTGYNAFGEAVAVKDALGNVSHTKFDRMGRVVESDGPQYTAPGPNTAQTPAVKKTYDALSNVLTSTDALGHVTKFTYDRLNHLVQTDAPGSTDSERLVSTYTYTRTGKVLSSTSPTGVRTEATYDDLDRQVTKTTIERKPSTRTLTTTTTYDDAGNAIKMVSPTGLITTATFDKAGDQLSVTDSAGVTTQQGYDGFGNPVRQSDGAGRTTRHDFDPFGEVVAERNLDPAGNELRKETYGYNANGNLTARTDAMQKTVTFTYDGLDHLVKQVEPTSASHSITTSWGYDAAGHTTRYTDGRGNATIYGYNSLGLAESVVEPSTTAQPALTDRTWTTAYDLAGNATALTEPGGVTRTRTYDADNRMIAESGSGGGAAAASRGITYDAEGRPTAVTSAGGSANTFGYDDRGDLLTAAGPAGNATFAYDDEGDLTTRTDAAGTATFTYAKGRLATQQDGASGVAETLGYDAAGLVKSIDYGAGRVRTYGFDDLGRLNSDVLKNSAGQTALSIAYRYDLDDHVVGKDTAGTAGAGSNTYGYDDAGRLTSWTSSAGTVAYGWDDSGNRIKAGAKTATYDERNRVTGDGDYTYAYSPRGTLASRTSSGLTDQYSFDAFDRMIGAEGETYVYDGLDRMINRNGATVLYSGTGTDPIDDGTEKYGRDADGDLLSVSSSGSGVKLTVSDSHDDVVGTFAPGGSLGSLDSSTAYDPFGQKTATTGSLPHVGFQGDWTDPATGQVDMGARWYEPGTGTFVSQDTANYTSGDSVLANKYAYAGDNPLGNNDPTGNWPSCGWCHKALNAVGNAVTTVVSSTVNTLQSAASYAWHATVSAGSWLYNQAKAGISAIGRGWDYVYNAAKNTIKNVWNNHIVPGFNRLKAAAQARAHEIMQQGRAITARAKAAISSAVQHVSLKSIGSMVTAGLSSLSVHISAGLLPKMVQSFTSVVQDMTGAATALYSAAASTGAMLVSGVQTAANFVVDHKAQFIGGVVGALVGGGCGLAIGATGLGLALCAAAAGAADSLVSDMVQGGKGWKEMAADTILGGVTGAVMGPLADFGGAALGGAARGLIKSGVKQAFEDGGAALASTARSYGNTQVGGLVGRTLAGRSAGSAGREAVETTGSSVESSIHANPRPSTCNSFAVGTAVLMADGTTRPIDQVKLGDKVMATDPTTGRTQARTVTALITGIGTKQMVELTIDVDGKKGTKTATIDATDNHPIWAPDLHRWVKAADLKPGSMLETGPGTYVQVTATRSWTAQNTEVHNLTVDGLHTYYVVAGGTPILVHNCPTGASGGDYADKLGSDGLRDLLKKRAAERAAKASVSGEHLVLGLDRNLADTVEATGGKSWKQEPFHSRFFGTSTGPDRARAMIDAMVDEGGDDARITFNLKDMKDIPNILNNAGQFKDAMTSAELRHICGSAAAKAITTFINGDAPC